MSSNDQRTRILALAERLAPWLSDAERQLGDVGGDAQGFGCVIHQTIGIFCQFQTMFKRRWGDGRHRLFAAPLLL